MHFVISNLTDEDRKAYESRVIHHVRLTYGDYKEILAGLAISNTMLPNPKTLATLNRVAAMVRDWEVSQGLRGQEDYLGEDVE